MTLPLHSPVRLLTAAGLILLAGCGRDVTSSDHRLAGAGLDPEEVGPKPEPHGGLIEYNWVNFAGAGLPLAMLGLVAYESAGPDLIGFNPPYVAVTGGAFFFEVDEPSPDTLFGNWGAPPEKEGTCYTNYDPRSFISSLVDVGTAVTIQAPEGYLSFDIGRRPSVYGPNPESASPVYFAFETWRPNPLHHKTFPEGASELSDFEEAVLVPVNYAFGKQVEISFPGGIPSIEASFGSIPMPLAAAGSDRDFRLPRRPHGIVLEWEGPLYDIHGREVDDGSDDESSTRTTCLEYAARSGEIDEVDDCLIEEAEGPSFGGPSPGQLYTGPWDTENGVTFHWKPEPEEEQNPDEFMTISVRFLGPLDRDDEYKLENVVELEGAPDSVEEDWAQRLEGGNIPEGTPLPPGRRPATACEDEEDGAKWVFDDDLENADGTPVLSLRGEPSHRLAEVTCRVPISSGEFTLTEDHIEKAYEYAGLHGAEGAIFYVTRGTKLDLETPDVRDAYGNRREISSVQVVSKAVVVGRFWYDAQQ